MYKTLYIGNLPFDISEQEVSDLFSQHGSVHSVKLIIDHQTGRFRGFGFVEMEREDAYTAMDELNGINFDGRTLRVNEARERRPADRQDERPPRRTW